MHVREHDRVVSVAGTPRVRTATLASGETLGCDAVVLAHGVAALRNVDGAVWAGDRTVYAQPLARPGHGGRRRVRPAPRRPPLYGH